MKYRVSYSMIILLALMMLPLQAQHKVMVTLSADMGQYQIEQSGENLHRVVTMEENHFSPQDAGLPALPLRTVSLLVPRGAELVDFNFSSNQVEVVRDHIRLSAAPVPVPFSLRDLYSGEEREFTGSFPGKVVSYANTFIQRGYTWFSFTYSPFTFDGETGTLSLTRSLDLEVEYRLVSGKKLPVKRDDLLTGMLKRKLENPGQMESLYYDEPGAELKSSPDKVDYLIVTTEELKPGFEPLIEWKIRKGLQARIVTMEEITDLYDDTTIQLKIKKCLYDYYLNHDLTWVLLGGDAEVVPDQGCYATTNLGEYDLEDFTIPTDLFYACFDRRFDWNSTVDNKIGQVYRDGHDLVPEIYISRVPVRTAEHVETVVNKILHFELDPPMDNFFDRILLSGVESWSAWEGKSDSHHRSEILYRAYIAKEWEGQRYMFYDTGTDFPGGSAYEVTAANMVEQLNTGFSYFSFSGHGNTHYIVLEKGPVFNASHALSLQNEHCGIVLANGCHVNAFDSIDPCLSEAFLRNPEGGAIAFFGSSRFGFGNPEESNDFGPSFQYNASFSKYLYNDIPGMKWKSFANVVSMAKGDHVHNGSSGGAFSYLLYAINPIGDPEMPLYTADPSQFDHVRIYRFGKAVTVNTGGIKDCRICLTSADLEEGFHQVVDDKSVYTFEDAPVSFQVTITGQNYKPYIYKYASATGINGDIREHISIYPNPAKDFVLVEFGLEEGLVALYDTRGSLLTEQPVYTGSNRLDLSGYPRGVYLLQFSSGSGKGWFKLVKQ